MKKTAKKAKSKKTFPHSSFSFVQIFKEAWNFLEKNFQVLFLAALALSLPLLLVGQLAGYKIYQIMDENNINFDQMDYFSFSKLIENLQGVYGNKVLGIILFIILLQTLITFLAQLIGIYAVKKETAGQSFHLKELFQDAFKEFPSFLWVNILLNLAVLSGLFLLIVPGIIFLVWFYLAPVILVFEKIKGAKALKESRNLVRGYFWRVLGYTFVVALMIGFINFILQNFLWGLLIVFAEPIAKLMTIFEVVFLSFLYLEIKKSKEKTRPQTKTNQ